jgi:hypothetical protein
MMATSQNSRLARIGALTKQHITRRDNGPHISRASMTGSFTLCCSLTDLGDLSDFLVLVSSQNSKAQCHLEFYKQKA